MDKDTLKLFFVIAVVFLGVFGLMSLVWTIFGETVFLIIGFIAVMIYLIFGFTVFVKSTLPKKEND